MHKIGTVGHAYGDKFPTSDLVKEDDVAIEMIPSLCQLG